MNSKNNYDQLAALSKEISNLVMENMSFLNITNIGLEEIIAFAISIHFNGMINTLGDICKILIKSGKKEEAKITVELMGIIKNNFCNIFTSEYQKRINISKSIN